MGRPLTFGGQQLTYLGEPLVFGESQPEPGLGPLLNSHEADDIEAGFKAAVIEVFEQVLRPKLARINAYGMPHRGDTDVLERFTKAEGLALERRLDLEPFMRELYRAWRARNPRRGLHFLRYYLRLLYPSGWSLTQLWHDPSRPYPLGVSETQRPGYYLTSRVRLYLEIEGDASGEVLAKVMGSLRSVVPARIVLEVSTSLTAEATARVALVSEGTEHDAWTVTAST